MKQKEWRGKNQKELRDLLAQFRERVGELRFGKTNTRAKNVREMRELRRNIARALTFLHQKTK